MIGGVLVIVSMYVPWCQIGADFIAPTYTFPGAVYTSDIVTLMRVIAFLLLLIPAYLSFIGSVFNGTIGYTLINDQQYLNINSALYIYWNDRNR